jgi:peptide/nickel transport system substrate-binding protein
MMLAAQTLRRPRCWAWAALALACALSGCAAPGAPAGLARPAEQQSGRTKVLNLAVTATMTSMKENTSTGGLAGLDEIHSQGLITTGNAQTFVGRLAERVPSVDDGSVSVLPDGRMRVVYSLRRGVTWHDGAPFTAADLAFTFSPLADPTLSPGGISGIGLEAIQAIDDYTAAFVFQAPYYLGNALQLRKFWPLPRHILEPLYDSYLGSRSSDEWANHPYWTSDYVHLGPFRLTSFEPGTGTRFRAYDGYFLGRPKVDVINIRVFGNENSALAELLAGTVDLFSDGTLSEQLGEQLKTRWEREGGGTVHLNPGVTRNLFPQMRAEYQREAANLDPRVRGALYHAMDRDALAAARGGTTQGAWSLVPPEDPLYNATKDALRRYSYDPERAKAILRDLGWTPGPDRILQHAADGRKFQTQISNTGGQVIETQVVADFWRQIGLDVEEIVIPAALQSNAEHRATYPGWEGSSGGYGDQISRFTGPAAAPPRWSGNRGGYDDPTANALYKRYTTSLSDRDQFEAMKAISDFFVELLPNLPMYYSTDFLGNRKGVIAFDDIAGAGPPAASKAGSPSRNAFLWDIE